MSKGVKRKHKSVELSVKLKSLDDMKNGISASSIAEELGVNLSTVCLWRKQEESLRQWQTEVIPKPKKRLSKPVNDLVDRALWLWYQEHRSTGTQVTGPALKCQALIFHQKLGGSNTFEASHGWLTKWKERHGVRFITAGNSHQTGYEEFKEKLGNVIKVENLTPHQIFNCDETGLNFRQIPRPPTTENESEKNEINDDETKQKVQHERVTFMACSNASGTLKLPLVFIGKYSKPRAIKNLTNLPVKYKSHQSTWMTTYLFEQWFNEEFVPQVTAFLVAQDLPPKAILLIDNYGVPLQDLSTTNLRVYFFPRNTALEIQPMDLGILQSLKTSYRKEFMSFILEKIDKGETLGEALKALSIRHVLFWMADAWNLIPKSKIIESWKPLWPQIMEFPDTAGLCGPLQGNSEFLYVDIIEEPEQDSTALKFFEILQKYKIFRRLELKEINEWFSTKNLLTEDECLSDEEVVEVIKDEERFSKENSSDPLALPGDNNNQKKVAYETQKSSKISLSQARTALEKVIIYCEKNHHYTKAHLLQLRDVRKAIIEESLDPQEAINKKNAENPFVTSYDMTMSRCRIASNQEN